MFDHCDEALAHLYTYLDGELDDDLIAERIRVHLVECPPCGDVFAFEERLKIAVRTRLREDVPIEVIQRIQFVIRSQSIEG